MPHPDGDRVAILGTVGVPARYGGFETLAENLVRQADARGISAALTVYCSAPQAGSERPDHYLGARLRYLPLRANGAQSIPYDILSMASAVATRHQTLLLLGVSGAIGLPLIRRLTRARIIVHIDGLEWQRAKFSTRAQAFLKRSERLAVRHADDIIADNDAIADHVRADYGREPVLLTYGGDSAPNGQLADLTDLTLPDTYALAVARAEPENNLEPILTAFATAPATLPLVVISNWSSNAYGRALRDRFQGRPGLHLLDAIYDPARLSAVRHGCRLYVHGHSAGGTNPALVETMHVGCPVLAFDCVFNRNTTDNRAAYFRDARDLAAQIAGMIGPAGDAVAADMVRIARTRYRWRDVADGYFRLLGLQPSSPAGEAVL